MPAEPRHEVDERRRLGLEPRRELQVAVLREGHAVRRREIGEAVVLGLQEHRLEGLRRTAVVAPPREVRDVGLALDGVDRPRRLVGVVVRFDEADRVVDRIGHLDEPARQPDLPAQVARIRVPVRDLAHAVADRARPEQGEVEVRAVLPAPAREGLAEVLGVRVEPHLRAGSNIPSTPTVEFRRKREVSSVASLHFAWSRLFTSRTG
jgi:hypothetical protein